MNADEPTPTRAPSFWTASAKIGKYRIEIGELVARDEAEARAEARRLAVREMTPHDGYVLISDVRVEKSEEEL